MKKLNKKTIAAIEYLKQNPTISMTKTAELFNSDRHAIAKYKKDDLYLMFSYENQNDANDEFMYYFSPEELKCVDIYLSNPRESFNNLKQNNIEMRTLKRETLYRWLKILGKEKTEGAGQLYHYDRTRFKEIKTEEDAYWLGFITADGCIIENRWLAISLANRDRQHLVKFCKYMGLNDEETNQIIKDGFGGAYDRNNPINNVKICSLDIIKNLEDKGITPRKSGKEKPYICKTKELELAYIRGLIDGDGFIGSTMYRFGIVGSYEICQYVQNFITNNIKDISHNTIREHGVIYKLEVNGRLQAQTVLKALYYNANIYLDRKYNLFIDQYLEK